MHRGNASGDESYAVELYVSVIDPQGLGDIASVTASIPGGATYTLYDDGQHADGAPDDGRYGNHIWEFPQAPPIDQYVFTVTDKSDNSVTVNDNLENIIDFPRNISPANNEIVNTANPSFSWEAVDGCLFMA